MKASQKTLMGKYYSVCCAIILLSMVLVGSIFMVLANDYLREEKISLLEKNVAQAARLTMENYAAHEYRYVSSDTLQPVYAVLGSAIEADIYLSDNKKRPRHKTSALNYRGIISLFGQFRSTSYFRSETQCS